MKNQHPALQKDFVSHDRAKRAVERIQKWVDRRYPNASANCSRLIIECLIEITEERRFIAQQ